MIKTFLQSLGIRSEVISTETLEELEHMRLRAVVLEHKAREAWRAYANAKVAIMMKEQGGIQ